LKISWHDVTKCLAEVREKVRESPE